MNVSKYLENLGDSFIKNMEISSIAQHATRIILNDPAVKPGFASLEITNKNIGVKIKAVVSVKNKPRGYFPENILNTMDVNKLSVSRRIVTMKRSPSLCI